MPPQPAPAEGASGEETWRGWADRAVPGRQGVARSDRCSRAQAWVSISRHQTLWMIGSSVRIRPGCVHTSPWKRGRSACTSRSLQRYVFPNHPRQHDGVAISLELVLRGQEPPAADHRQCFPEYTASSGSCRRRSPHLPGCASQGGAPPAPPVDRTPPDRPYTPMGGVHCFIARSISWPSSASGRGRGAGLAGCTRTRTRNRRCGQTE